MPQTKAFRTPYPSTGEKQDLKNTTPVVSPSKPISELQAATQWKQTAARERERRGEGRHARHAAPSRPHRAGLAPQTRNRYGPRRRPRPALQASAGLGGPGTWPSTREPRNRRQISEGCESRGGAPGEAATEALGLPGKQSQFPKMLFPGRPSNTLEGILRTIGNQSFRPGSSSPIQPGCPHPVPATAARSLGQQPPHPTPIADDGRRGARHPHLSSPEAAAPRYLHSPSRQTFRLVVREPGARVPAVGNHRGSLYNCPRCHGADSPSVRRRSAQHTGTLSPRHSGSRACPHGRLLQSSRAISRAIQVCA